MTADTGTALARLAVAVLLVAKPRLEAVSRALTQAELAAVLELAVISVIVLPLLPSQGYGPWGLWNPREIWWVVVLVAGLSFVGFVAVRLLGEKRGLAITGAVGGLVSSTAVTVAMAERSRQEGVEPHPAAVVASVADVDAVTIAFTRLGPGADEWKLAAAAISVAAVMNTLVKLGFGLAGGAGRFRVLLAAGLGAMAAAGAAAAVTVYIR